TRRAADFLESTVDLTGVIPISCGIDRANYRPDDSPRDRMRILFVGRLTTEKRADVTLRAIARLVAQNEAAGRAPLDLQFDIVGGGDQRSRLEQLTQSLGLQQYVTFQGRASDEQLIEFYRQASVFVIASVAELQSIATLEAMASGLPIIAADAV